MSSLSKYPPLWLLPETKHALPQLWVMTLVLDIGYHIMINFDARFLVAAIGSQ